MLRNAPSFGGEEDAGFSRRIQSAGLIARAGVLTAGVIFLLLALPAHAAPPDLDTRDGWIDRHGLYDPDEHEGAGLAEEIFDRLVRVTNDPEGRRLELAVVGARKPYGLPTARALPDGTVVVTEEMLDLCFGGKSHKLPSRAKKRERGEAWLAWLLGHEISHIVDDHDDYLTSGRGLAGGAKVDERIERAADFYGMRYMMQAGFDPDELFDSSDRFFAKWQEALAAQRPDLEVRDVELENRLREVRAQVDYFQWGTRLLQLGRYQDGLDLLETYRDELPSREVLSNLGFAYYQLAAQALADCDGRLVDRFMLPTRIDPRTLAHRSRRRGTGRSSCFENTSYEKNRDQARRYLEKAVEQQPGYRPALLNLVALHLLDEQGYQAMATAGALADLAPAAPETINALALAQYLIDQARDLNQAADRALEELEKAWEQHPDATYLLYNQARINDERQRGATANELWQRFVTVEPASRWTDVALERLGQAVDSTPPAHVDPPVPAPLHLGSLTGKRSKIEGCERQPIEKAGSLRGHFYANTYQELYALEIKDVVEVVEQRWPPGSKTLDGLRQLHALGEPERRLPLHRGELLVWPGGYAAEVEADGSVWAEVWYVP